MWHAALSGSWHVISCRGCCRTPLPECPGLLQHQQWPLIMVRAACRDACDTQQKHPDLTPTCCPCCAAAAAARVIYVDPAYTGSVEAGSSSQPYKAFAIAWRTLPKAMLNAGVTINIRPVRLSAKRAALAATASRQQQPQCCHCHQPPAVWAGGWLTCHATLTERWCLAWWI
jgi:hypothetical protein